MENKKVKGARVTEFDGIKFRSELEVRLYKTLLQEGFKPEYEKKTFHIWEGFLPKIPFYTKNHFKRKDKRIEILSKITVKDNRPLEDITYTPDFIIEYNDKTIIIEAKGSENDVFPYKFKIFRKYLEKNPIEKEKNYEVWEVFSKRQLLELIKNLKKDESK